MKSITIDNIIPFGAIWWIMGNSDVNANVVRQSHKTILEEPFPCGVEPRRHTQGHSQLKKMPMSEVFGENKIKSQNNVILLAHLKIKS